MEISKEKILENAVPVENSVSIDRDISKCVACGLCKRNCEKREGIHDLKAGKACVNCGQCIQICPMNAMMPKSNKEELKEALKNGKVCIAYTSPGVRVSIGEAFGMEYGTFAQGKMVSALRKLGFQYVLDVTFGADLTIIEEANELLKRIENNEKLPMFTSCCPAWVKYAEQYYPELLENLSTCKSPISMQASIVHEYFVEKNRLNKDDIFTVAITPCTAKKYEVAREELPGTNIVITTRELVEMLQEINIDLNDLEDSNYDSLLQEGSGAGMIFGNTGGVMEAAIRSAYYFQNGKDIDSNKIELKDVRGLENVKEAKIDMGRGIEIKIAVIHQMSSAVPILEEVKNGNSKYDYIEIMNCLGGCIGGGGQIRIPRNKEIEVKEKRMEALYKRDKSDKIKCSYENPDIVKVYDEFLGEPLNKKCMELLHTKYKDKTDLVK